MEPGYLEQPLLDLDPLLGSHLLHKLLGVGLADVRDDVGVLLDVGEQLDAVPEHLGPPAFVQGRLG